MAITVNTMPESVSDLIKTLAAAPWWVTFGLLAVWMGFLAYKLWDNKLTQSEIDQIYGHINQAVMKNNLDRVSMIGSGLTAAMELMRIEVLKLELAQKNPDLRTDAGQKEWFRIMGQMCAGETPDYKLSPSAIEWTSNENYSMKELSRDYHYLREEIKKDDFPITDAHNAEKWADLTVRASQKEKLLRLIVKDAKSLY